MLKTIGFGANSNLNEVHHLESQNMCSDELRIILYSEFGDVLMNFQEVFGLGLVGHNLDYKYLTFVDELSYVPLTLESKNVSCVITTPEIEVYFDNSEISTIINENPRFNFFRIYNKLGEVRMGNKRPNQISKASNISPSASIAGHGVKIYPDVVIEANVTIYPNVEIKSETIVRSGAVIGSPGFEYKRHKGEVLPVIHDGHTVIGESVEIGPGTIIGQGFFGKPTIIGSQVKTDNLVSIAHGSLIGDRALIAAGAIVAGNTTVGMETWIGPGAVLSNGLIVGSGAFIAMGSHVFKDVAGGDRVIGSPARSLPYRDK